MLSFVRETSLNIVLEGALSTRRGFLFYVSAGFYAPINPLSGMSVNLVSVDQWLLELKAHLEAKVWVAETEVLNPVWSTVLEEARDFLSQRAHAEKAVLQSLSFREERHWGFSWKATQTLLQTQFTYEHYLESLPVGNRFELLKVCFLWEHDSRDGVNLDDYRHEGFKLLKTAAAKNSESFLEEARSWVGVTLASASRLQQIKIDYLTSGYSLILP
ncbi:MAG: hypothetical protein OM95_13005 [Bdellovibrio sp. ArHS]|uniref:hypothetical protein n=1 Tax=Bdellovibrio sp. ArHS TaxID=1569284 RepID=UPI000583B380|nr:hypothetical protein [Bdellovibrio sp. ArHS]KHD87664.1 MAG: hypothetical protein OM95_13005 [Bdellovibrio sp. ArHS]